MSNRWMASDGTPPGNADEDSRARDEGVLPAGAVESWRTWLLTGKSAVVSDRRRLRGSHRGLKRMLVDGTGHEMPQSWKHFSGAMVRLAINDALNALPKDQTHVVWLAYFAGMSNSEIARRLGMSVRAVQHRLKLAFEHMSDYVEHGRAAGRRVVLAVLGWLSWRRFGDSGQHVTEPVNHVVMTGALIAAGATAAVLVGATAAPVMRPSIQPAVIAPAPVPATPSSIPAATRSVSDTIRSAAGKVAHGDVVVPTVPPLPLPSPPPVPSPPPLPSPPTLP